LQQALHKAPDIEIFKEAAYENHIVMLTQVPKVTPRIYEHALLVHVPALLFFVGWQFMVLGSFQ
jgi:hypothetical protein